MRLLLFNVAGFDCLAMMDDDTNPVLTAVILGKGRHMGLMTTPDLRRCVFYADAGQPRVSR